MRDIVATIQPDQDDIVRADAGQTVCVQGAPGTGKTAVGLHRVAYLLYAYREQVRRRGVVMVGPNQAFLSYIRNVLPALGEIDVTQTTVGELVKSVPVRGSDSDAAAVVKGDARMAEVLRRALWASVRTPAAAVVLALLFKFYLLSLVAALVTAGLFVLAAQRAGLACDYGPMPIGHRVSVPPHTEVAEAPAWLALICTLVANSTLFTSLLFGTFYLWIAAPNWSAVMAPAPSRMLVFVAMAALAVAAAAARGSMRAVAAGGKAAIDVVAKDGYALRTGTRLKFVQVRSRAVF